MARKRFSPERIITMLGEAEVLDTPDEAKVLVEAGRKAYNRIRPHSSLGYRPPWSENSL